MTVAEPNSWPVRRLAQCSSGMTISDATARPMPTGWVGFAVASRDRSRLRRSGHGYRYASQNLPMTYALGFCSRTGSAAAVAVDIASYRFAGRWAVDLVSPGTPVQLYHAATGLPPITLERFVRTGVDKVRAVAGERLDELVAELGRVRVVGVVTGDNPVPDDLPVTQIVAAHPLMHAAEGQLYRDALIDAAAARGLATHGVPRGQAQGLVTGDLAAAVAELGLVAGRPWRKEHKLAAIAALVAAGR